MNIIHRLKYKSIEFFKLSFYKIIYGKRFKYKHLNIRRSFILEIEKPGVVTIGKKSFFNNYCSINCLSKISIGEGCLFGERVSLYDHTHIFNKNESLRESGFKTKEIKIGNNCWIGSNVVILQGTTIGDNSVIGAGLVISGEIPANSVVKRNKDSYVIEQIRK